MNNNRPEWDCTTDDFRRKYDEVRAVVLGSTGFIGRWVARGLCKGGAKVILPVRDKTSAEAVFSEFNIKGDVLELDLFDAQSVRRLYRDRRPTVTFNLAGYGVDRAEKNELLTYRTNVDLIRTVCSAISEVRDLGWAGADIVNVGTAQEYGLAGCDLAEDLPPEPTTLYGKSKLAGTNALKEGCHSHGLKGLTARLFSVYGPGEVPNRLLPTLIRAVEDEEPIHMTAGVHRRDFVYVEDAAESLLRLGLTASRPGEAVNVATGVLTSVRVFAETAAELLGINPARLRFGSLPTRLDEMNHGPVAIRRLVRMTGCSPGTSPANGIQKTVTFRRDSVNSRAQCLLGT